MDGPIGERAARILEGGTEDAPCPACGKFDLDPFYAIDSIPVHSVMLLASREEARSYPNGRLRLAFCRACGFVCNTLYDATLQDYSPRCEESQAFSPTFNAFAREAARRVLEIPGVRGGKVLEIGCGKGDFLALLLEGGAARGVGIDPGAVLERFPEEFRGRVEVLREKYAEKHGSHGADLVCCRHTLEHIGAVGAFLDTVRASFGEGRRAALFLEVPDVLRVLREGAFWDIYYEHCSYFTAGSLARLCGSRRFSISDLSLEFAGQYILLIGYPENGRPAPIRLLEADREQCAAAVDEFRRAFPAARARWKRFFCEAARAGQRVVLWGSSSKGVSFLTTLGLGAEVDAVVDINPYRQGKFMPGSGHAIVAPEALLARPPGHVVLMNPIYRSEVAAELGRLGIEARLHTV